MTKIIPTMPMPSPNGTNSEDLWVPANWLQHNPYFAFDAAPPNFSRNGKPRPARDQEQNGPDLPDQLDDATALEMISQVLKRVADPGVIMGQIAQRYEHSDESGMDARRARDQHPPSFRGMPKPGGTMEPVGQATLRAQDSAFKAYPDLARIRLG
jgi:hypothetical protein